MQSPMRRAGAFLSAISLLLSGTVLATPMPLAAQSAAAPNGNSKAGERPWLYQNSDVPVDKAWLMGELPNGLRYAIRRNGVPPGQVSIRVRVDVGSLMEKPEESGFAHYIEHLTFRGSKYVPDGEAKRLWQRLGATFGSDSNAETTPTGTTYALDLPSATEAGLDESLKILMGMVSEPNIVPAAVDAERAVVLAERRESFGPQFRMSEAVRKLLFAGQPMADHTPIGSSESLNAANAPALKAFHDRWYRPDRTVIAISGDFDPAALQRLLVKNFSGWTAPGKPTPLPNFGKPDPKAPSTAVLVEPGIASNMMLAYVRPWKPRADTIVYNQGKLTDQVALNIINRRLEQAARAGGSFIQASVDQSDISRSIDATVITIVPSGDWEKAVKDVRAVIEDARRTPPTQEEIDREYRQLDTALAIQVENKDTESAKTQVETLVGAVDIRETTVTPEAALDIFRTGKPGMTPARMQEAVRRLFQGEVVRSMLTLAADQPGATKKLASAISVPVAPATNVRLVSRSVSFDKLPLPANPPATVVATKPVGTLGMEIIEFSNGVRLSLFSNDAEDEKVRVAVRFGHGWQDFSPSQPVASWAGAYGLAATGVGEYDQRDIDDLVNGRRIGFDFSVDDDAFKFSAVTRPADLHDQLRLFAAKLASPGWDSAPLARMKSALLANYDSYSQSPDAVLGRDLRWLLRDKDVRFRTPSREEIAALTPEAFRSTWEPVLREGPIEVQMFGDVKREDAIAYVADTFGVLPARADNAVPPVNLALRFPAHNAAPLLLQHDGASDQAAGVVAWPTEGGFAARKEARQLEILAQIFNDRLFEKLRSGDGAAYSPNVSNNWPFAFGSGGYIQVISQVKPDKLPYFFSFVANVAQDLRDHPVTDDELQRIVTPMRQLLNRASTGNAFWMSQMEGATRDPRYITAMQNFGTDLLSVTPADIQALARKYLDPDKSWSAMVMPSGRTAQAPANVAGAATGR